MIQPVKYKMIVDAENWPKIENKSIYETEELQLLNISKRVTTPVPAFPSGTTP